MEHGDQDPTNEEDALPPPPHVSLKRFLAPYYVCNALAVLAYPVLRFFVSSEALMQRETALKLTREQEIFALVGLMLVLNLHKKPTLDAKLSLYFLYLKAGILAAALYMQWFIFGGVLVAWIALYIVIRQPLYTGPTNVIELTPTLMARITRKGGYRMAKKNISWFVFFYATWNDACVNYDAMVAELSLEFASDHLQIGKLNVGKNKGIAKAHKIDDSPISQQLPTFILFQNGKEILRAPCPDAKGDVKRVTATQSEIATAFDLKTLSEGKPSAIVDAALTDQKKEE